MTNLNQLHELGQSTWLNYMRRTFIQSGELRQRIAGGIQGITADAATFEKTIMACSDYDEAVRQEVAAGTPARRIHEALMIYDVQIAADLLHPVYESSGGLDGFVSLELDPALSHDTVSTVAEIRHLEARVNRANVMVEIPATAAGIEAVKELTRDGVCINVTHIFSVDLYEKVAQAYIEGLEEYLESHSVWRFTPTSVASFSVSAIDSAVDPVLATRGHSKLQGKTAVALASVLYHRFRQIFSGPRWEKIARRGGRVLRPKWTRTAPRNFNYPDTCYIEALIAPDTVTTFSPVTLHAFRDHGTVAGTLSGNLDEANAHLARLAELDIDLDAITISVQRDYLVASEKRFQSLTQTVSQKRDALEQEQQRMVVHPGAYQEVIDKALDEVCQERVLCRIWDHDHIVWKPQPDEISNRLGWLHVMTTMEDNIGYLQTFTQAVLADGYTHALLIGMGGSSLAAELFHNAFGKPAQPRYMPHPYLELVVVDTTDADAINNLAEKIDPAKTLFIVATKSGTTVETLCGFRYFYNRVADALGSEKAGAHFVAITDPDSPLVETAVQYNFRHCFINDPNIGGRYSALSYFGLLPAALVGADLARLLDRASAMACNTEPCHCAMIQDNLAARLGVVMGELAQQGRDKVTLISSLALASFGDWVEQLIAESTGKEGKGILPVVSETPTTPDSYGADRLFVHLRLAGDSSHDTAVEALVAAGQPVVILHLEDLYDLGGHFFLWEMATAVAGHTLQINPFNQPNVEAAKIRAREMVATYKETGTVPKGEFAPLAAATLHDFLAQARPGDYIALHAYVPPNPATDEALQALGDRLRQRTGLAVTVGYGPRFLHSTGQLHKGGSNNGLFVQLVSDAIHDVPIPDVAGRPEASLTYNVLKMAQALGDAQALRDARRRLIRFNLGTDVAGGLQQLAP